MLKCSNATAALLASCKRVRLLFLIPIIALAMASGAVADHRLPEDRMALFRRHIPAVAEQFIGMPYRHGGDGVAVAAIDNSHLFCLIYSQAAEKTGLRFSGYMPMKLLLRATRPIAPDQLMAGDLIVLTDNHAAMVYNVLDASRFLVIYVSQKRQRVITFNSQNAVYDAYWMKHLKGFYRIRNTLLRMAP
jgi:hypothetical protein